MVHYIRTRFCDRRPDPDITIDHGNADVGQVFHLHFNGAVTVELPDLAVHATAMTQRVAQQISNIHRYHLQVFLTAF
ncbi:hypothetical protein D3C85_1755650 [compost metagenome]